jgi:hypothetical protein
MSIVGLKCWDQSAEKAPLTLSHPGGSHRNRIVEVDGNSPVVLQHL